MGKTACNNSMIKIKRNNSYALEWQLINATLDTVLCDCNCRDIKHEIVLEKILEIGFGGRMERLIFLQ